MKTVSGSSRQTLRSDNVDGKLGELSAVISRRSISPLFGAAHSLQKMSVLTKQRCSIADMQKPVAAAAAAAADSGKDHPCVDR